MARCDCRVAGNDHDDWCNQHPTQLLKARMEELQETIEQSSINRCWVTLILFVKPEQVQPCLVDVQHTWEGENFSYVQDCAFLKEDRIYGVLVRMTAHYPFLENQWREKWDARPFGQ